MNDKTPMSQFEIMKQFSKENCNTFNDEIFSKSENNIIKYLVNLVKSCERQYSFYLHLDSYSVIDNLDVINRILFNYEDNLIKDKKKRKMFINVYNYNDIRSTDMVLLALQYTYGIGDEITGHRERLITYVIIPTFVDKYYFRIKGKYYMPAFQIIENSTYNMVGKKNDDDMVVYKCTFMKLTMTRTRERLTANGGHIDAVSFVSNIFNKNILPYNYILAKIGYTNTIKFLGLDGMFVLSKTPHIDKTNFYSVKVRDYFVIVPIHLYNNSPQLQSFIVTLAKAKVKYNEVFYIDSWLNNLGGDFSQKYTFEKGLKVLESLEGIYDTNSYLACNLPYEYKKNIYCILRWLVAEFSGLMVKNNLDISTKKLRCEEYLASLYGVKLATNVKKIAEMRNEIKMYDIRKYINIRPDFLLSEIKGCTIVNHKNISTDNDALYGIKFTFKGPGGIDSSTQGAKISDNNKQLQVSHMGVLGMANTHNTTPGVQGTLTPMVDLNAFNSYKEPNTYFDYNQKLINEYEEIKPDKNELRKTPPIILDPEFKEEWNELLDNQYGITRDLIPITRVYKNVEVPSWCVPIKRIKKKEEVIEDDNIDSTE